MSGSAESLQEDKFRREFIAALEDSPHLNAHVSYIESHQVTPGIPDLHVLAFGEVEAWIELKVVKCKPNDTITVRPSQKLWHRKRNKAGGKSWFVVLDKNGDILVVPGHVAIELPPRAAAWRDVAECYRDTDLNLMIWKMK